ncbi:ribosomal protein L6, alpha-beta domain-containing protein [Fusarium oxysporum]|nr:ribosomal protein L6, alpha-beta domain-containing protein [Fusarium oxysporum]
MKYIHSQELLEIPEGVKVSIKSRIVTVEGPRGKLVKDLSHLAVNFTVPKKNQISIEIHHGVRKNVATLRTVRTLINNLIIGVTKGFKYKMRYVYAHFPINVNVSKNAETDLYEVEIRNFIGEKLVRRIVMQPGVDVEASTTQKDELVLSGNSLENVSQSAADIQQICRVRNKDIRKVGHSITPSLFPTLTNCPSSLTVCTSPRRATLSRTNKRGYGHGSCFFCVSGSQEWRRFIVACHVAKKGLQNKFQKAKR